MVVCCICGSEDVQWARLHHDEPSEALCEEHRERPGEDFDAEQLLSRLVKAARRQRSAEIDASACGTSRDFRASHDATTLYEVVMATVLLEIEQRITDGERRTNVRRAEWEEAIRRIELARRALVEPLPGSVAKVPRSAEEKG